MAEFGVPANPAQGLEIVFDGETQSEDDGGWRRVPRAVSVLANAGQIGDDLLVAGDDIWRVLDACLYERKLKYECILGVIVGQQNVRGLCLVHTICQVLGATPPI